MGVRTIFKRSRKCGYKGKKNRDIFGVCLVVFIEREEVEISDFKIEGWVTVDYLAYVKYLKRRV